MRYTYEEVKKHLSDEWDWLQDQTYVHDTINEWAQSCVSIYTAQIQQDWANLDFDDQNRWRECFSLSDLGDDKGIDYLMTIDLCLYYEGLYDRAYRELCNDKGVDY